MKTMETNRRYRGYYPMTREIFRPMKDLLIDQNKGRFLTPDEKKQIKEYAEEQRKKNLNKKK